MPPSRSRRLRLLESLRKTINDLLHDRVRKVVTDRGQAPPPDTTSAIYTVASREAPELLDQLFCVHQRATQERGEPITVPPPGSEASDLERKRMLSAVRAAVTQTHVRFGT